MEKLEIIVLYQLDSQNSTLLILLCIRLLNIMACLIEMNNKVFALVLLINLCFWLMARWLVGGENVRTLEVRYIR